MSVDVAMRVMHIITRMIIGGAQENTLYNCLDLRDLYGDKVLLVTGPSEGPEGDLLRQGRARGLDVFLVPRMRRAISAHDDIKAFYHLRRLISEFQPDVVHTHSAKAGILGRRAAWVESVPAIVHTIHGAPFHPYQSWLARGIFRQCERSAASWCHKMIAVADAMSQLMINANVAPPEKFVTIYSGMDVKPFLSADCKRVDVRNRLGFRDNHIVIGKIARLFNLKGHSDLISAARKVADTHPDVRFLLVGDGILRRSLERRIADFGLSDRFVLTGLVPPEEVSGMLGAMDVLVHASLREGLARALPQALIAGKPVISYDIDGAREVVIDGRTGFLVPPGCVSVLADRIGRLAMCSVARRRMGETGRLLFTEQFRHEAMTHRIRQLYLQLLGSL
jgi:glycosyltransferase involved in cell wall biosynthesis